MSENIGEVLRIVRIASDRKTKDVAKEIGTQSSYISDVEKGRRNGISLPTIKKMAKSYSFRTSQIFDLLEYYNSLDNNSKYYKYRKTLIKAIEMIDKNLENV